MNFNPNLVSNLVANGQIEQDKKTALWGKLRPTALFFAIIMAGLAWILTKYVLSGAVGEAAFGDGQAVAIVTAALLIVGAAVNSLGNAMLKLSEDTKPDPPPNVPETTVVEIIRMVAMLGELPPTPVVPAETHNRAREDIDPAA